jgi:GNAT superfamily N-acetyltransferase
VNIRRGDLEDAAALADLARTTFYDAFAATNDATDMALHLERAYGVPQQGVELQDPGITTLLVEDGGTAIAYAQIRDHHAPECVTGPKPVELWRFYVDRRWHGRGIAAALMDRVKSEARLRGARTMWLGVWEHNARARAFYAKCGFTDVGEHIFLFGTDPQTDRVMTASL